MCCGARGPGRWRFDGHEQVSNIASSSGTLETVYRLSSSSSRHVKDLGGRITQFAIIPPFGILLNDGERRNHSIDNAYVRLALGDGRMSGRIPVSWAPRFHFCSGASAT